ncbi:hypothetical protein KM043_015219 [Ampulex compressa]|nr:hypothetical protein KM043_015219 [Ampulex compressa]
MDNLSDSFKGDLDSVTSTDSLHLISDEFHIRHLSTPDVSNIELSKRIALLELENERLRMDLENMRIELNARIAANQGLKGKITEMYVEMQSILQDKQKVQYSLTDTKNRLSAMETSAKWYQSQVHDLQASKKTLQIEIDTYQNILKQRQQSMVNMNTKYKELNADYTELTRKYQNEKRNLEQELKVLKALTNSNEVQETSSVSTFFNVPHTSTRLEAIENELQEAKAELKATEQRLLSAEVSKMSVENALGKQRILIASMEENIQKCETEKNDTAGMLHKTQLEMQKLKSENETLQTAILSSKREQSQVEDAISQLKIQLTKMITQYKLLKSKNVEAEEKLNSMQDVMNENKRLKALSYEANTSLIRRLRQEKRKVKNLENKLYGEKMKGQLCDMKTKTDASLRECLKQALSRNKDLKEQLKILTKSSDESIDEGYGDSSAISSIFIDIPSPISIDSVLLQSASKVLSQSRNFCAPWQNELHALQMKMNSLKEQCAA